MDETAYRQILSSSVPSACPFEKSILSGCAACSKAEKRNIAEREIVACNNAQALERCIALRNLFRINFTSVSYTHLRAHETDSYLVCRLLLEKKKKQTQITE